MDELENTGEVSQSATNSAPPVSDENGSEYRPRPARPFAPRGADEKQAARGRKSYLKHRDRILRESRVKYKKAERTPEWRAASHDRMSLAKKRDWKKMPSSKRHKALEGFEAERAMQQAKAAARRLELAWEIIKRRYAGVPFNDIVQSTGLNVKVVNAILRMVDAPEGNPYICDRTETFTRGSAISLMQSLGYTSPEFARVLKSRDPDFRERRTTIWYTGRQKKLAPFETELCRNLRTDVARKLLADATVNGLSNLDSYDRSRLLVTLFPRLNREYKLLLETLPSLRLLGIAEATEKGLANFVIERAAEEESNFELLLRWLPGRKSDSGAQPFNQDELALLRNFAGPDLLAFLLLRHTGLRGFDATDLRWSDIDLRDRMLSRLTHKRGKQVWIPLHQELLFALDAEFARRDPRPGDHVLLNPDTKKPMSRPRLYTRIKALGDRAGVNRTHPHRFRDTLAVDMLLKGASPYDVAKTLGDTVSVVEQHYAPYVKELRERTRKIMASDEGIEKAAPNRTVFAHQPPIGGKVQ